MKYVWWFPKRLDYLNQSVYLQFGNSNILWNFFLKTDYIILRISYIYLDKITHGQKVSALLFSLAVFFVSTFFSLAAIRFLIWRVLATVVAICLLWMEFDLSVDGEFCCWFTWQHMSFNNYYEVGYISIVLYALCEVFLARCIRMLLGWFSNLNWEYKSNFFKFGKKRSFTRWRMVILLTLLRNFIFKIYSQFLVKYDKFGCE